MPKPFWRGSKAQAKRAASAALTGWSRTSRAKTPASSLKATPASAGWSISIASANNEQEQRSRGAEAPVDKCEQTASLLLFSFSPLLRLPLFPLRFRSFSLRGPPDLKLRLDVGSLQACLLGFTGRCRFTQNETASERNNSCRDSLTAGTAPA